VPIGEARISSELRAAITWARAAGGAAPGSEYAATAASTHSPRLPGGASLSASQAIATALIPSPSAEAAAPGSTRRRPDG
jgi:hypothetical protein